MIVFGAAFDGERRVGALFQPAALRPFQSEANGMHHGAEGRKRIARQSYLFFPFCNDSA